MGKVYLLHFEKPYHHARHYIGYCENGDLDGRIERHRNGRGARLLEVVTEAGISFRIARIWHEVDRNFERKLKNRKKSSQLCPICKRKEAK